MKKVCAEIVPENLSEDQKLGRKCFESLDRIKDNACILNTGRLR